MRIIVLLDNGHGSNTAGKRSPDGRLYEYAYCREIVALLHAELNRRGIDSKVVTPEATDISITTRCKRVNAWCDQYGAKNCLLVSIHNNAAGKGGWNAARGWLSMVDDNASAKSKDFADMLFDAAKCNGLKTRQYVPSRKWYLYSEALGKKGVRLGILKSSKCPAVLTENLFQDNLDDVEFLLSTQGKNIIVNLHADAIEKYVQKYTE